jgi:hypothetical protein
MKREIICEVREEPAGGYSAEAIGESIFTDGDTWEELRAHLQDATRPHFGGEEMPDSVRLLSRREETLAVA